MKNRQHILKSHEPILDYAFRKRVYPTSVYSAIEKGKIRPDYIGTTRMLMIDLRKYGAYKFRVHNPDKSNLIRWFISTGYQVRGRKAKRKTWFLLSSNKNQ